MKSEPLKSELIQPPCWAAALQQAARMVVLEAERALAPTETTVAQLTLLRLIKARPGITAREIYGAIGNDQSTTSRSISILANRGWIARTYVRKAASHALTREGDKVLAAASLLWRTWQREFERRIAVEKVGFFADLLSICRATR